MFQASLHPSSGGQTAFSLPIVFCPVKGTLYKVLRYGGRSCIVWSLCACICVQCLRDQPSFTTDRRPIPWTPNL